MRVMFSDASSFPETKSATLRRGTACEKKGTGATAWRGKLIGFKSAFCDDDTCVGNPESATIRHVL